MHRRKSFKSHHTLRPIISSLAEALILYSAVRYGATRIGSFAGGDAKLGCICRSTAASVTEAACALHESAKRRRQREEWRNGSAALFRSLSWRASIGCCVPTRPPSASLQESGRLRMRRKRRRSRWRRRRRSRTMIRRNKKRQWKMSGATIIP